MSFSRQIAAGDVNPLAPLTFSASIGTTQIQSIQINGVYSGASLFNRAIQDASTFTSTTTGAYCSYDANPTMSGATAYNHFFGFEARNIYNGTGGLTTAASFCSNTFQFLGSGTIAAMRHFDVIDATVSGPTLTENSGLYVPNLTVGTNNYGVNLNVASGTNKYNVYAPGTAVSYFNGQVEMHAGQKWSGGFIDATAGSQRINFTTDTNLVLSGAGTITTIASLNDAANTYEPLFFNASAAVWYSSGTERLRADATAVKVLNTSALPAGGTTGLGLWLSSTSQFGIFFGSGAPTLSAAQGSIYLRSDGSSTSTRAYVNTNGTTGWAAITTAS